MKHSFYAFAAAVVMLLPSCTLDEDISVSEPEKYTLTVNVGAPATKVVGQVASDMMLKNFQILVFTDKGNFETSTLLCSNVTQIDLKVLPGAKKVWTVANIPGRIADPENETAFLNQLTQLRFNTTEKMTMSKFESVTINADTELNIALEHIASKVVVDKITRQFNNAGYASIPLTVKRIYLSNVAGDTNFACTKNRPSCIFSVVSNRTSCILFHESRTVHCVPKTNKYGEPYTTEQTCYFFLLSSDETII